MSFYTDVICKDARFKTVRVVRDMDLLEPVTRQNVLNIMTDAKARGVVLEVGETYRSKERQYALWRDKKSKLAKVGVHHFGLACDLYIKQGPGYDWVPTHYKVLGELAEQHGMVWGGDWDMNPLTKSTFFDGVHVQRVTTNRQPALFAGTWYPDEHYDPRKEK